MREWKTDNLMAFVEAQTVYPQHGSQCDGLSGLFKGHRTIREAIEDPCIHAQVKQAMQESGEVLIRRYGFDRALHSAYIEKILSRFANPYLVDEVDRVGRQPLRNLAQMID